MSGSRSAPLSAHEASGSSKHASSRSRGAIRQGSAQARRLRPGSRSNERRRSWRRRTRVERRARGREPALLELGDRRFSGRLASVTGRRADTAARRRSSADRKRGGFADVERVGVPSAARLVHLP
jgi:hypothetical protein